MQIKKGGVSNTNKKVGEAEWEESNGLVWTDSECKQKTYSYGVYNQFQIADNNYSQLQIRKKQSNIKR